MLGYSIKLRSVEEIKELCYETEDGGIGQDSIAFDYGMLVHAKFYEDGVKLVQAHKYDDDMYAYLIENKLGAKTYVHLSWIGRINKNKVISHEHMSSTMTKITSKEVFNPTTGHITPLSELPMCDCGQLGTTQLSNGTHICKSCVDTATHRNNYSYRPDFKFIGKQLPADVDNPVWYGLEVEISTDKEKLADFAINNKDSVYLKSDASIKGDGYAVEVVSMPHSFSALMAKGSWLDNISKVPTNSNDGNGTHVHISRTAFKDDRHYALFYFLIHKMEKVATKVGGRKLTSYCALKPTGKVHNKGNKANSNDAGRTVYLNEQGNDTIEARFFKGTTKTTNLKAYVQFLESMLKYTRYHSKTVTSKGWFGYVTKKSQKYKELLEVLGDIDVSTLTDKVVYKEPTIITTTLDQMKALEVGSITTIKFDSRTYENVTHVSINSDKQICFRDQYGEWYDFYIDSLVAVAYEKED